MLKFERRVIQAHEERAGVASTAVYAAKMPITLGCGHPSEVETVLGLEAAAGIGIAFLEGSTLTPEEMFRRLSGGLNEMAPQVICPLCQQVSGSA